MLYGLGLSFLMLALIVTMIYCFFWVAFFIAEPRLAIDTIKNEINFLKMKIKRRSA